VGAGLLARSPSPFAFSFVSRCFRESPDGCELVLPPEHLGRESLTGIIGVALWGLLVILGRLSWQGTG